MIGELGGLRAVSTERREEEGPGKGRGRDDGEVIGMVFPKQ